MKHLFLDGRSENANYETCYWVTRRPGWRPSSAERNRRIARRWVQREPTSLRALFCAAREELLFCRAEEGAGPWLEDADIQLGMQHALRFLRIVGECDLLGPYGLRIAQNALALFHPANDPALNADYFRIALQDPAEWPREIREKVLVADRGEVLVV